MHGSFGRGIFKQVSKESSRVNSEGHSRGNSKAIHGRCFQKLSGGFANKNLRRNFGRNARKVQ